MADNVVRIKTTKQLCHFNSRHFVCYFYWTHNEQMEFSESSDRARKGKWWSRGGGWMKKATDQPEAGGRGEAVRGLSPRSGIDWQWQPAWSPPSLSQALHPFLFPNLTLHLFHLSSEDQPLRPNCNMGNDGTRKGDLLVDDYYKHTISSDSKLLQLKCNMSTWDFTNRAKKEQKHYIRQDNCSLKPKTGHKTNIRWPASHDSFTLQRNKKKGDVAA